MHYYSCKSCCASESSSRTKHTCHLCTQGVFSCGKSFLPVLVTWQLEQLYHFSCVYIGAQKALRHARTHLRVSWRARQKALIQSGKLNFGRAYCHHLSLARGSGNLLFTHVQKHYVNAIALSIFYFNSCTLARLKSHLGQKLCLAPTIRHLWSRMIH